MTCGVRSNRKREHKSGVQNEQRHVCRRRPTHGASHRAPDPHSSRVRSDRRPLAGAGDRREHCDLQRGRRSADPTSGLSSLGCARGNLQSADDQRAGLRGCGSLTRHDRGVPRPLPRLRALRRVELRHGHRDGSRRARTRGDGDGHARCPPRARDTCLARPLVLARRRFTGRCSNGDPQPRLLATTIWSRPWDSRPNRRHRLRSSSDCWRDAAELPLRRPLA
jgi:hypothetical protein